MRFAWLFLLLAMPAHPQAFSGSQSALSNPPVAVANANSFLGTLASGTTFFSFTTINAITLKSLETRVQVIGVIGSGDAVKCNDAAGSGLTATTSAGAAVGTVGTVSGSVNIAAATTVSCHIESAATTRPIYNIALSYIMQ